ncbi:MAG: hypothetical protein ACOC32_02720 [Nanoarchaeota archaeon]
MSRNILNALISSISAGIIFSSGDCPDLRNTAVKGKRDHRTNETSKIEMAYLKVA